MVMGFLLVESRVLVKIGLVWGSEFCRFSGVCVCVWMIESGVGFHGRRSEPLLYSSGELDFFELGTQGFCSIDIFIDQRK